MKKFTIHPHDDNSFKICNAKDEPLGLVTLARDDRSWYATWIDVDEGGPDYGDTRATRGAAIEDLLVVAAAGRVEIIDCS